MTDIVTRLVISAQTRYTSLKEREEGQALVEYALILALISVVCVAVLAAIGGKANGILRTIANNL